jgi:hypothetical protein
MAQVSFKGYVSRVAEKYIDVSERHSKPDGQGGWETVGYTNFRVWIPEAQRGQKFEEKAFVEISGKQKTETSEKDGKKYNNLIVSADSIIVAPKRDTGTKSIQSAVDILDDSSPF